VPPCASVASKRCPKSDPEADSRDEKADTRDPDGSVLKLERALDSHLIALLLLESFSCLKRREIL
jgi:hypothetical protein